MTLLPPNATGIEVAVDETAGARLDLPVAIDTLWSAQDCPAKLLPWLAWAMSVDVWRANWSEDRKREVIGTSAQVHRSKGTVAGVKEAVMAIGSRIEIREWFETGGAPYTAEAVIDLTRAWEEGGDPITADLLEDLQSALAHAAPARVHFTTSLMADFGSEIHAAAVITRPLQVETFEFEEAA